MKVCLSTALKNPVQRSICRESRQAIAVARPNKSGTSVAAQAPPSELPSGRGVGVPQIGLQACYNGAVTCFSTRRAPSSPHLACRLNGSIFLQPCGLLSAAPAGRLLRVLDGAETCGTLRGRMLFATRRGKHGQLNLVGASGKRLVFFLRGVGELESLYLLDLRPNFDGLGWVRLKVRFS